LLQDVTARVIEVGNKDLSKLAITFPMDTVYMFEAAVPLFTTFYDRYYSPGYELDKRIPKHREITLAAFDGSFIPLLFLLFSLLLSFFSDCLPSSFSLT